MAIRGLRQGERGRGCRGRASVRSKRRGLNKASGPHKAELSDILINNCSSIKGQAGDRGIALQSPSHPGGVTQHSGTG